MSYSLVAGDNARVSVPGPAGDFAAYSECVVAADPQSDTLIVASKRFSDTAQYVYFLVTWTLSDGQWVQGASPPMPDEGQHCGDPALMCNLEVTGGVSRTNVYLVGNSFYGVRTYGGTDGSNDYGISLFKSTDLGATWQAPPGSLISRRYQDDKPACVSDTTGGPYTNRLYVTWDSDTFTSSGQDGTTAVLFARSLDNADTWTGVETGGQAQPPGSPLPGAGRLSAPVVMPDGTLHVFSVVGGNSIVVNTSSDGGASFSDSRFVAQGLSLLTSADSAPFGLPFRVVSLPAASSVGDNSIIVAWTDVREGALRIYCRTSTDNGQSWTGTSSDVDGEPLHGAAGNPEPSPGFPVPFSQHHDFHPQLATAGGVVVCSYYRHHQQRRLGGGLVGVIDVLTTVSIQTGDGFPLETVTTDHPWNPEEGLVDYEGNVGFIGDYFGLCAVDKQRFYPVWTDTRNGKQDLYTAPVDFKSTPAPPAKPLTCGGLKAWLAQWLASGGSEDDPDYQATRDLYESQCPKGTLPTKVVIPS